MKRYSGALVLMLGLAACGGGRDDRFDAPPTVAFASGPVQKACQDAGRKAASRTLCGCIQAVADQSLTNAQQRRGAKYFKNPAVLQEVRQSDNASNEKFWQAWKAFGVRAEEICAAPLA